MKTTQRRPQLLVLAVLLMIVAIWSAMYIRTATQKTLDQRVHEVGSQLKCPICQNESVADSPSSLAQQMRMVIRQQLQEGKSEQEVVQYFESSYGEKIINTPPWQGFYLLVWLVPIALLLSGVVLVWLTLRDWSSQTVPATSTTTAIASAGDAAPDEDDDELAPYRRQLERELAEEDPLFAHPGLEGR